MMNNNCRECGAVIHANAKRCRCGWKKAIEIEEQEIIDDKICQFRFGHRRCKAPAGCCPYPYGKLPWLCSGHRERYGNLEASIAYLDYVEANYEDIIAKYSKPRFEY